MSRVVNRLIEAMVVGTECLWSSCQNLWVKVELVRMECVWCCQRQLWVNVVEGRLHVRTHVRLEIELRFLELALEVELVPIYERLKFSQEVIDGMWTKTPVSAIFLKVAEGFGDIQVISGTKARVDTFPGFRRASVCEVS